jgi:EAL domain-containing protein (putative c-di-GMP-specific phosphodiesterase class I)
MITLATGAVRGYEALSRFGRLPGASPQDWFAAAHRAGLGAPLESRAIAAALRLGASRPAGTLLSLNVSPNVVGTAEFQAVLPDDLTGLQFEVTEDQLADDGGAVLAALETLRERGGTIAVDDVGAGYAGFRRLMAITPDVVKLDRELVSGAATGHRQRALIEAIVHFAHRTGGQVCAEGLETDEDVAVVASLGVAVGQGFVLGRPAADFSPPPDYAPPSGPGRAVRPVDLLPILETLPGCRTLAAIRTAVAAATGGLGCSTIQLTTDPAAYAAGTDGVGQTGEYRRVFPLTGAGRPVGALLCTGDQPWTAVTVRAARVLAAATGPAVAAVTP